ncbi:MAG: nicotinate-nucleotide--dimethylbenzimidazole phosphoribosyltransferase [Thermoplasmata archaeon]
MNIKERLTSENDNKIFILLAGYTEVSTIEGISSAGSSPDEMKLTPALDAEIIIKGKTISTNEPPMTPDGIPTPSIICRAAMNVSGLDAMIIDAGLTVFPRVPFFYTGLGGANKPTSDDALHEIGRSFEFGKYIGRLLDQSYDTLIIGESIPGGTTTAYMTLRSEGYDLKTSSSMPGDPQDLKEDLFVESGSRHIKSPYERMKKYGDYMMALSVSISSQFSGTIVFGGGTQMANVYHLDNLMNGTDRERYVSTTSWVMRHRPETMHALVPDSRLLVADLDFSRMKNYGLTRYEDGNVREGAGMGAASYYALLKHSKKDLYDEIERCYESFFKD